MYVKAQKKVHTKATMSLPLECALMGREGKVVYMCVCVCVYLQLFSVQSLSRVWLLATHGLQHTRPPCPSPIPRVYLNSCPLSQWCHPTISSSVIPFSSCLQSFPASGSFQMSHFFASRQSSINMCWINKQIQLFYFQATFSVKEPLCTST